MNVPGMLRAVARPRLFYPLLFVVVFAAFFPATYAIDDECDVLALAYAQSRGTLFLDQAGVDLGTGLEWRGHRIAKFSPFHAALLAPFVALGWWRLGFLLAAAAVVAGGEIARRWLRDAGLDDGWLGLYYLSPGLLYYAPTLMSTVPCAVAFLAGAWLLFGSRPRPVVGAACLGLAALLHIWVLPLCAVLALGWWWEVGGGGLRPLLRIVAGAAPAAAAMAWANWATTGSPALSAYWLIGTQRAFSLANLTSQAPFYLLALLVVPPGGWALLSRRYAMRWSLSATAMVGLLILATYYYRDGRGYGPAGWVPGLRFLVPLSLLAVVPAARWLARLEVRSGWTARRRAGLLQAAFVALWLPLAALHQDFLRAHDTLQRALAQHVPIGALVVGSDRVSKELAPVHGARAFRPWDGSELPAELERRADYLAWLGGPGQSPPEAWRKAGPGIRVEARSWIWSRDLWLVESRR